jgi:serine/threonine-protein kinase
MLEAESMKVGQGTAPIKAGEFVGPYEIRAEIGSGGMGVVYEAQPPCGEPVALKLLHPQRLDDARAVRRFLDEGTAGAIVVHPNVAATLMRGQTDDGVPFLVMQRVRGESLGGRIGREGPPSLRRVVAIVQQILAALHAIHSAGVVHGDVKSDNILVERQDDDSDVATLIDFGLAHVQFCADDVRCPGDDDELVSGTPEYMAPEVIRGEGSSTASDVYAVGVILYELITGSTPFSGGTPAEIVRRHLTDRVVPPSLRRNGSVPAILERIVLRALAKNPEKRFRSAAAFASALTVATPVLDDEPGESPAKSSREAPTLDWARRDQLKLPRHRRIANGTPPYGTRK